MSDYVAEMRALIGHRPLLVVGALGLLVNDADELLLVRRGDMNLWGLPGGAVELGEPVLHGLKREIREETGLDILDPEPMALYSGPGQRLTYPNGDEIYAVSLVFLVRRWRGTPRPDGVESIAVRFFPLTALPEDMVPLHKQRLQHYGQYQGKFLLLE